jgi:hypothetical protein
MIVTTVEQALARAHSALAMPTTYWLGGGGFEGAGIPSPEAPGKFMSEADLQGALDKLKSTKPEVWAKYQAGLEQSGLTLAQVPRPVCARGAVRTGARCYDFVSGCLVTTWPSFTGSVGPGLNDVRTTPSLPSRR